MNALRLFVVLSLAVLALFAAPAHANLGGKLTSDLHGVVVDVEKRPVAGAVVIVEHLETGRIVVRKTGTNGRWRAMNVRSDGHYRITVVSELGVVRFQPGRVLLGERMRRNAVVGVDAADPPKFMRAWQWNQDRFLDRA